MSDTSSTDKDYYYILGVTPQASMAQIAAAYEQQNNRFGPHVSIGGTDPEQVLKAYKEVCEAYEVLSDPNKRREYDQSNTTHLQKSEVRGLWGKSTGAFDPGQKSPATGEDTKMDIEVTLKEAVKGTYRQIRLEEQLPCQNCLSMKPVQRLKCEQCRGVGFFRNARLEDVNLPTGLHPGREIRIPNKGRYDQRAGRHSDLVLNIQVRPHQLFTVNDRDIACTVPITFLEAILGGEITVPTATGKVVMKVQPMTQTGRQYRLKGLGLAGGDFLVTVQVVVPSQISTEELELFRKLKQLASTKNPRDDIFQKLSD